MMSSTQPRLSESDTVEIRVPIRAEFASTVRVLVASLAADAEFSVDEIDDLRLAVSEVFASLQVGVDGDTDSDAYARFEIDTSGPGLTVVVSAVGVAVESEAMFELDDLALSIVAAAVDEFILAPGSATLVKYAVERV